MDIVVDKDYGESPLREKGKRRHTIPLEDFSETTPEWLYTELELYSDLYDCDESEWCSNPNYVESSVDFYAWAKSIADSLSYHLPQHKFWYKTVDKESKMVELVRAL